MGFIDKPQRLWWRKVLFQVHLWVGIIVGLYIIVVSLTGSILVFKAELAELTYPQLMTANSARGEVQADLVAVIENFRSAYPTHRLVNVYPPGIFGETFFAYMEGPQESWLYVFADPADGSIKGAVDLKSTWLYWVGDLHFRLLAGEVGFIVNGIGALFLILLCVTGVLLWWPGVRTWTRALKVNFHRSWRRINFDLHSAAGFWLLSIIFMWAVSGGYFVWPRQFEALVNKFSSVETAIEPKVEVPPETPGRSADLRRVLTQAAASSPGSTFAGIVLPEDSKMPVTVFMARGNRNNFSAADQVYFDPSSGRQLAIWHSGINPTLGSKSIFWLGPLHFGAYWGLGVKIIWAALGLSLPLLTVTGALMYWNRSLGRYWKGLRAGGRRQVATEPMSVTEV